MVAERDYIIQMLKDSGIRSQVYTTMKKLKQGNEPHVGAVLISSDTMSRSGSKKIYMDQEGQQKRRVKLWNRTTVLHVVIADTSHDKVEAILEAFFRKLKKGFPVDGNWVDMTPGGVDWVDEGDSILKAQVAAQFDVTLEGGIYEDHEMKSMEVEAEVQSVRKGGRDG